LNEFQSYLVSKSAVNEKNVSYYVRWVSSCYAFTNQPLSDVLTQVQKQEFLKHFAKTHENWQVKQAEAALRLYDYYLSKLQLSVKSTQNQALNALVFVYRHVLSPPKCGIIKQNQGGGRNYGQSRTN